MMPDSTDTSAGWADCEEALQIDPDHLPALLIRGLARLQMGLRDQALEDYETVIEKHPDNPAGHLGRWMVHFEEEQYSPALDECAVLLELNPNHALAYLLRSFVHEAMEEPVEALLDRERATELNPALADIMLGDIQHQRVTKMSPELMRAILNDSLQKSPSPRRRNPDGSNRTDKTYLSYQGPQRARIPLIVWIMSARKIGLENR